MSKPTIERSKGLPTGIGPWVAGGGYSGSTEELDRVVREEAKLLSDAFGRDVEIRFNSDRESGGAWLKDDLPGFSGGSQVGLTAALRPIPPKGKSLEEWRRELDEKYMHDFRKMDEVWRKSPKEVAVFTYVASSVVSDPSVVNSGNKDRRYAYQYHASPEAGLAFLLKNTDRAKVNPYKGERLFSPDASDAENKAIHAWYDDHPAEDRLRSKVTPKRKQVTKARRTGGSPSGLKGIR